MSHVGFYVNTDKCTGCKTCQIACKDVNQNEVGVLFRKVHSFEFGEFPYPKAFELSMSCNHCERPACMANCSTGAIDIDEDGRVLIDQEVCIGCQMCVESCPYGAPQFIPELNVVGKCSFCKTLVDQGEEPACVASCPARALEWGDIDELREKYGTNADVEGVPSSEQTNPSVVINVHRSLK